MVANLCQRKICQGAPQRAGGTQKKGRLTLQCDELWSFVDHKGNKQWVWLALDADTREIVGVYIGARSGSCCSSIVGILASGLPESFRGEASPRNTRCQCAIAYPDFWVAYGAVLPSKRHRAVGKQTGKTSYIELADTLLLFEKQERTRRFNNTLRQRVSRLVRKTLSFSKSVENHIGAI